jgi:predicted O-methyltransferase YrrM
MNSNRQTLLNDLAAFGQANDARAAQRSDKMLNITPDTGELLALLVHAAGARRILEIGTSNGYSTLWLADAVESLGGRVITIDVSPKKAELARLNFERAGLTTRIQQHVGDAGQFLSRQSAASFDMIFLDAERGPYILYWPAIQSVLRPGGLVVADNAISHADEMAAFVQLVRETSGYLTSLVPVGKGEFLAVKPQV